MSIRIDYQEYSAANRDPYYDKANATQDTESDHGSGIAISEQTSSKTNSNSGFGSNNPFGTSLPCYGYQSPLSITMDYSSSAEGVYAKGVTLEFDDDDNFATVVTVQATRGNVTQSTTIYPQERKRTFYPLNSITMAFTQLTLTFSYCVSPQTRVYVAALYPGRITTWTGEDLTSFPVITNECNPVGTELPYGTSEFTLRLTGSKPRFKRWDKLFIYHNNVLMAKHYIDEVKRDGDLYHVKGFDVLGVLDDMTFDGMYFDPAQHTGGYTVEDCVTIAITNQDGEPPIAEFDIDETLFDDDYYDHYNAFTGYIPACTRREALHYIANAGHLTFRVKPNGVIAIHAVSAAGTKTLDSQYLFLNSSFEHLSPYTSLDLEWTIYERDGTANDEELYKATVNQGNYRALLSPPAMITELNNCTASGFSYGPTMSAVKMAAWADVTAASDTTLALYGKKYKESKVTYTAVYTTDTDLPKNVLQISGHTLNKTAPGVALSELSAYYGAIHYSDKWTGKLLYAAFGSSGATIGGGYAITVPGKGTISGWLTKAVLTLSEANRYVEATITGIFTEE